MTTQRTAAFKMADPSHHLATNSPGALTSVSDFHPHQPKGHEWQKDAFAYNRLVAEVGALHSLTAELVASGGLVVVKDTVDPQTAEVVTEASHDARSTRVMRAFVGPVGGQKDLKRRAALHYQIAGESILLATPLLDNIGQERGLAWEFLSTQEVKIERKKVGGKEVTIIQRSSGYDNDGFVPVEASSARWWRSDAEFSGRADSPMRRILPICRELVVLSEVVDAIAKSRLNAGVMLIPDELSFGPDEEVSEEGNENGDIDKFMGDLMAHLSAPIEDRTSAAGLVPLLMKAPAEFIDKVKMLWLSRDLEETYQGLRTELLVRIAQGLDAPPEMISGKASLNHWSAFSVDMEFINRHVVPVGEALCEFLTVAYLRRMLVKYEDMTPEEASCYRVVFDSRPLSQSNDESETAAAGWDRVLLSDEAWIAANGYLESDMPSEEERKRRLIEKMVLSAPGIYGVVLLPILYPELAEAMTAMPDAISADKREKEAAGPVAPVLKDPNQSPVEIDPSDPANGVPEAGPPTDAPDGSAPNQASNASAEEILAERLVTAADAALTRALDKGASRVLTRVQKHPTLRDRFSAVPKNDVMATMSGFDFKTLHVNQSQILGDAWDAYQVDAAKWIEDWALSSGAPGFLAKEVAKATSVRICRQLDEVLFANVGSHGDVYANGLRVPLELVVGAIDHASGEIAARS